MTIQRKNDLTYTTSTPTNGALSTIDIKLKEWDDEECLFNMSKFLDRVGICTQFIENDDGLLTHQVLVMNCGDKVLISDPQALEWPLQQLPIPEAFEGRLN